ncbi:DUF4369 domain-containing protein [Paramuribaculum intestinale]|uniref:DUF4369 domain-containing protein n=1 Tax=Paramuribaculum intestinale TaxID=2094151 RepID=UPI0025B6B316|nr:DUF4369 domain-containing protein [Paramuribaculum intestinale]
MPIRIRIAAAMLWPLLLWSCSSPDHFTVEGRLPDGATANIELTYYADGGIRRTSAVAKDGRFTIKGSSTRPTLALLTISGGAPAASLIVDNGDKIKLTVDSAMTGLESLSGNSQSEKLWRFVTGNRQALTSGSDAEVNRLVTEFVGSNSTELCAAAIMVTAFRTPGHEAEADSLIARIDPEARPQEVMHNFSEVLATQISSEARGKVPNMTLYDRRDTTVYYAPYNQSASIIAFTSAMPRQRDSVTAALRQLADSLPRRRFKAVEVTLAPDSAEWKRLTARDSASWIQAWAPAAIASPSMRRLAVPRVPFFIVADSTGTQIYAEAAPQPPSQPPTAYSAINSPFPIPLPPHHTIYFSSTICLSRPTEPPCKASTP